MARVVVGMSGGVDSSVAAYLLKNMGYDVIGVTMEIWQSDTATPEGSCCGLSAAEDAKAVAASIGIPHYTLNFRKEFKTKVIDYFVDEYLKGATPNPCIACNRYVKWESLLNKSLEIGAEYIATGHYAKVVKHPATGRFTLRLADTTTKDQTYALYNLTQFQLEHTLMPLGSYEKPDVRKIAEQIGLKVADKPDSQDICFVPDGDYASFIRRSTDKPIPKGSFVSLSGEVLGEHSGITDYTIGQRKGLGIALGVPAYVCDIRPESNEVVLGPNEALFDTRVVLRDFNCMSIEALTGELRAYGKLRYSQKSSPCVIRQIGGNMVEAVFDEPQRAATSGQGAVFYDEDGYVIGGGVIVRGYKSE